MFILFWLTGSLMALLAIGALLPALLRTSKSVHIERTQVNVAIARERERELRKELDDGILSDAEFDAARGELEQGLAIDLEGEHDRPSFQNTSPLLAAGISALIPMLALGVYLFLGTPDAYEQLDAAGSATLAGHDQPADVDTMLAQLKARLVDEPNDIRGWTLLGNAYMSIGQYADAVPVYRRLVALEPGNAERLVRLADALAMSRNGILAGEPEALIGQASGGRTGASTVGCAPPPATARQRRWRVRPSLRPAACIPCRRLTGRCWRGGCCPHQRCDQRGKPS